MKKEQLEGLKKGFETDYAQLRTIHVDMLAKLKDLETPESIRKYSPQYRESERTRIREEARDKARQLGSEIEGRERFIAEAETAWDLNRLLRNARFVPEAPKPVKPDVAMFETERQIAELAHSRLALDAELANSLKATAVRQQLELADDSEVENVFHEAIAANDLATLNVLRGVLRTRTFSQSSGVETRLKAKFVNLAECLNLPERDAALELIGHAKRTVLDCQSTVKAIIQNREDTRAVMNEANQGKRPWQQKGAQA